MAESLLEIVAHVSDQEELPAKELSAISFQLSAKPKRPSTISQEGGAERGRKADR
jgi:hypothetical protein